MDIQIRRANLGDAEGIGSLVSMHVDRGNLLPRSFEEICASIENWVVALEAEDVVGCGSLVSYSPLYTELRSLAVSDRCLGQGIGKALVDELICEARKRGVCRLFALTRALPFFEHVGFLPAPIMQFPEKVWRDCMLCPRQDNCDECAVVLSLNGVHALHR